MNTELIARLRERETMAANGFPMLTEAADTLEAQDKQLAKKSDAIQRLWKDCDQLRAQVQALQEDALSLWMLLDDVDSADDRAKSDDKHYREICQRLQARRWAIWSGDKVDAARGNTKGDV